MAKTNKDPCGTTGCPHYQKGVLMNCRVPLLPLGGTCREYSPDFGFDQLFGGGSGDFGSLFGDILGGKRP